MSRYFMGSLSHSADGGFSHVCVCVCVCVCVRVCVCVVWKDALLMQTYLYT